MTETKAEKMTEAKAEKLAEAKTESGWDDAWHRECAYGYFWETIPGIGAKAIEKRYRVFRSYEKMYLSEAGDGLNEEQTAAFRAKKKEWNVKEEYEKLRRNKMWCIPKGIKGYPDKLMHIADPPSALFAKGRLPKETAPSVAVVGARNCSPYGREAAAELGRRLAGSGIQVVSGMAVGIDGISQTGALRAGGAAFGVLGLGADVCYPRENMDLYQRLCRGENGSGVISEYAPGTEPAPWKFPVRNRIISALSDVLVVVEAKERSGTFITVSTALEQGKDVYAFPGRMGDRLSYGCNRLIAQGAGILYDMDEFIREILERRPQTVPGMSSGSDGGRTNDGNGGKSLPAKEKGGAEPETDLTADFDDTERELLDILEVQFISAEELMGRMQKEADIARVLAALATLECRNLVESEGSFYRKKVRLR